jgi:hypothetical protein
MSNLNTINQLETISNNETNNIHEDNTDDGFILVKSKKSIKNQQTLIIDKHKSNSNYSRTAFPVNNNHNIDECVDDLNKKIDLLKYKLKHQDEHQYYSKLIIIFEKLLKDYYAKNDSDNNNREMNIICFGLGSIDDNLSSRYQLALLLLLIDDIKLLFKIKINQVEFYDPIFSQIDKNLLEKKLKFQISNENVKCMHQLESLTLFYMPHCGKALYNNLLYSNWSVNLLKKLIIFGNSFNTIKTHTLNNVMNKYYTYINDSYLFINEIKLCNIKCDLTNDSFYDLSLHMFNVEDFILNNNKNSVMLSSSSSSSFSSSSSQNTNNNGGSMNFNCELVNQLGLNYEASKLYKPVYDNLNELELI